jgi:UDP-N-acetylglucosamine/UDP-N-acetylgalactosamine diphosphorylase
VQLALRTARYHDRMPSVSARNADVTSLRAALQKHGQEHLLAFADELSGAPLDRLLSQIAAIDFDSLDGLIEQYVRHRHVFPLPADLAPATYYPHDPHDPKRPYDAANFRAIGEDLIRAGKVAAFTVAGGQGTRLGWNGPKGTFPATVVTGKPLFRVFAEQILATQNRYGVRIPWYIMTSDLNDADTRRFFADNNHFGLPAPRENVFIFPQGLLPSIDAATGCVLLAGKGEIAMNPDGHGGSIKALRASGAIDHMRSRGIEHISYFQVDNPMVRAIDPLFVGLHSAAPDSSGEMSSKMVAKAYAEEKVGVFCQSNGKTVVIEYSDLPMELANQMNADGSLRFNAGSIAIHMISVAFVERLTADAQHFALPYHRADKKVPFVNVKTGELVQPSSPNGVKLEAFVFDAIPLAKSSIVYETSRTEEFGPIKNAEGVDSAATSHQLQSERAARWLESCGVQVPRNRNGEVDAKIEVSPLTAMSADDLKASQATLPGMVERGAEIVV